MSEYDELVKRLEYMLPYMLESWRSPIEDAAAAIRSLGQRGQWQDISTAPKDGTTVLIADSEHVNEAHYVSDAGERLVPDHPKPHWEPFDRSYWDIHASDYEWFEPTHWQPLPPPPTT